MFNENSGIILIVDDNPTNLSVLSQALKEAGYKSRVAIDGESAIEQVQEDPPDLILLDVQMPGIDGFETCTRLKADPATKEIPVIFITASVDMENKVKGLSLGGVDYITKPFQQEEVLARVKVHLTLRFLTLTVQKQAIALQQANQELRRLANMDGLTGIANRRRFDEYLQQEWHRLAREQEYLSLILCDIDYFKNYNDHYGHQAGDDCLKQVAQTIKSTIKRPADLVARYGGEEFALILPNTTPEGAIHIAESIRTKIKELKIAHASSKVGLYLTLSLGVSSQVPSHKSQSSFLINVADQALYTAKDQGRDHSYLLLP
jgi:diguanylate cyclase (GGDEF)-like protein